VVEELKIHSFTKGKIIQVDYDYVFSAIGQCEVCLTKGQVRALLAIADYVGWATRWYNATDGIDQATISEFRDDIVRRLIMACCDDSPNTPQEFFIRVNGDGYQEVSHDGGDTWGVDTDSDYRFNSPQFPPPDPSTLGDDPECSYTLNLLAQIERAQQAYNAEWEVGENLSQLIAAIVTFLTSVGLVGVGVVGLPGILIAAIVFAVLAIGRVAWNAAFTSGFYSDLKCVIYNTVPANGVWSASSWESLLAGVDAMELNIARIWTWNLIRSMGSVGLTNASFIPSYSEDTCNECLDGCTYDWSAYNANGTEIVSQDGIHIIVDSEALSGGLAYATITTTDTDLCCKLMRVTAVTGTITECAVIACGEPDVAFSATFNITGNDLILTPTPPDVWIIQIKGTTVFQVDIELQAAG